MHSPGVGAPCQSNDGKKTPQFTPQFPGTCPYITSVGGTQSIEPEIAWIAGSGGFSNYFPRPAYQAGAVTTYLDDHITPATKDYFSAFTNFANRGFPDVSAHSVTPEYVSFHSFLFCNPAMLIRLFVPQLRRRRQRGSRPLRRHLRRGPRLLLRHRPPQRRPFQSGQAGPRLPQPVPYVSSPFPFPPPTKPTPLISRLMITDFLRFGNSLRHRLRGPHGHYGRPERRLQRHQRPDGRARHRGQHHPLRELERDGRVGSGHGAWGAEFREAVGVGVGGLDAGCGGKGGGGVERG